VKSDAERIASYLAKTVPTTVSLKIASVLTGMKSGFASAANSSVSMETQVQAILNDADEPTIQYPFYLNFGREIWKEIRVGIDGATLASVAQSLHDKYVAYGLKTAVLADIADAVFNITVT
jgi:hypothetical protein